ncbi:MAG TPA: hypothetical protein VLL94_08910 [Nitrospiraceae bacterium]|nr:hypothetical protein [Nitrospiraceae bacterium]
MHTVLNGAGRGPVGTRAETTVYLATIALLQLGYLIGIATSPSRFFGVNQLRHVGILGSILLFAAFWTYALRLPASESPRRIPQKAHPEALTEWPLALLLAALGAAIFFLLGSNTLNPDGTALLEKIPRDVASHGAHVTHDEMLELFIHSRVYLHASRMFGWSVAETYKVLSALSGGVFLLILCRMSGSLAPGARVTFVGMVLAGGYLQVFFGDVENYTLVASLILLYIVCARSHLLKETPLWVPTIVLSAAIAFHLLAGWLLPSWLYLLLRSLRRRELSAGLWSMAALALPLVGVLVFFHFHGLPIQRLLDSSHVSGMGGHYARYIAPLQVRYFGGLLNVILLLLPVIVVLPALAYFRRLGDDPYSRFLQVATISMLVFIAIWRAQLGVYNDWNLFAPGMIPIALLVAQSLYGIEGLPRKRVILVVLTLTAAAHSLAWIVGNHFGT